MLSSFQRFDKQARYQLTPRFESLDVTFDCPDSVRNLGVVIDSRLSFDEHVSSLCRSCYFHMKAFRQIRHSLTIDTSKTIARSIVMSILDYCNSVLYGTSKSTLKRLQHIQNSLVRLVYTLPSRSSCQPLLKELSWLPIEKRINFKIALFDVQV